MIKSSKDIMQEEAQRIVNLFKSDTRVFHEVLGWEDYLDSAKNCAKIHLNECIKKLPLPDDDLWHQERKEAHLEVLSKIDNCI